MNIKDYKFHVGDEVITTEGERGRITSICTCERCQERGFHVPFWAGEFDKWEHCIDKFTAENGFSGYYKIGEYRFNNFDKAEVLQCMAACERELQKCRKRLETIEEIIEEIEAERNREQKIKG